MLLYLLACREQNQFVDDRSSVMNDVVEASDVTSRLLINCWNHMATVMLQLHPTSNFVSGPNNAQCDSSSAMNGKPTTSFLISDILNDVTSRDTSGDQKQNVTSSVDSFARSHCSRHEAGNRKQFSPSATVVRPWEQRKSSSDSTRRNPAHCESDSNKLRSVPEMARCSRVVIAPHFRSVNSMTTAAAANIIMNHSGTMFTCSNSFDGVSPLSALYQMTKNNFDSTAVVQDQGSMTMECIVEGYCSISSTLISTIIH